MTDTTSTRPQMGDEELRTACDWPQDLTFKFYDEPGEHDPCYVIMPGGAMLPFAHHDKNGVDQARAQFIVDACNEKITAMSRARSTTGAETAWIIRLRELADAMLEAKTDRHCTGKIFVELSDVELLKNVASRLEMRHASLPQPTAGSTGEVTGLDLEAIEARANAAAQGPWRAVPAFRTRTRTEIVGGGLNGKHIATTDNSEINVELHEADAAFIAHARTDIPALIAEIRANRASTPAQSVLVEALQRIRLTPSRPFPDRGAHSERAFSEAIWRAWSDIQRIADEALSHAPSQPAPVVAEEPNLDDPNDPEWQDHDLQCPLCGEKIEFHCKKCGTRTVSERELLENLAKELDHRAPAAKSREAREAIQSIKHGIEDVLSASPQPDRESEVTDAMVERLAKHIAIKEARSKRGGQLEVVLHEADRIWRRMIPEARELLTAALTSSNRPQATEEGK